MSAASKAIIDKVLAAIVEEARLQDVPVDCSEGSGEPAICDGNFWVSLRPLAGAAAVAAIAAFLAESAAARETSS